MARKLQKNIIISVLVITLLLTLGYNLFFSKGKQYTNEPISKTGFLLGTIVEVKIYDQVDEAIFDKVFNILDEIENKMSVNIQTSEVSKINNNAGIKSVNVSEETFNVINKGKYYSSISNGNFDISIGPLVELWNIGSGNEQIPSSKQIQEALNNIDYRNIILDKSNYSVRLSKKGMMIDLGGIAKGYAADKIASYLKDNNINSAIINLGGNVYALGARPDKTPWKIAIQNPLETRGTYLGTVELKDKSVVSSGVYERYFVHNDKRYHHILSPFTGYPVENSLLSVTIVSDKSIDGDGLSTAVFTLGLDKGANLINSLEGIEAIFIDDKQNVYITTGLKNSFELTDNEFTLKILSSNID
ncbi:FAD:protein FMN transferase [Caldisalinibacter kiritimatiensis]|uniref:FAD:protein FMN transferase n=1 Tax=Caldisalinibacter kiritimatiensis TaxID=1304284 RepID=R1ASK9_9FIRM|nr:FAD:protein FMN transferase [Caldisalinibacter kiritimatiensis]EOC99651.1 Putative thiamin biosynthesis lipoprotein ApbE [Caldisalinibacter kiritimatiensis]